MPVREGRIDTPGRLDIALSRMFPDLTRSRLGALVKAGAAIIDGRILHKPGAQVNGGEHVEIDIPEAEPAQAVPQDLPIRIVHEDADLIVIDKDAGMVVHPAPGHPTGTLVNALLHHVDDLSGINGVERPGIVHRLDRGTSGLLVVAKHDLAHRHLAAQFADHSAGRTYLALCLGTPKQVSGTVRTRLGRHPTLRMRFCSVPKGGKEAVTHWSVVARSGELTLIECRLETGRTHQVRVHLSESGWPIVGDPLYGPKTARLPATIRELVSEDRPLLHARQLRFQHPDGRALVFDAPLPADFVAALAAAGLSATESPGAGRRAPTPE